MKRLPSRLSALSMVVTLGLIAIARAQRSGPVDGSDTQQTASDSQQTGGDPFATSRDLAAQPASDAPSPPNSSVRLVSVQDFPSQSGAVPPRSVPNDPGSADGTALTIHQPPASSDSASAMEPPGANDPLGLRSSAAPPADSMAPAASAAPAGGSLFTRNASLASANMPESASQPPAGPAAGRSIDLGPAPAAGPIEVAQAPAGFEPPSSAAPIAPSPQIIPEQAPQPAYGATNFGSAAQSGFASAAPQQSASEPPPQSGPQPSADAGPTFGPIAGQTGSPPGMTIGSLRPIDPAPAVAADTAALAGAAAHPDAKHVEGSQSPQLTIEKIAPTEVQIGKPARFELRVRNVGSATADGVEIHDAVPQGMQFVSSNPPTTQGLDGQLAWSLGELKPGERTSVQLELLPIAEGDIHSIATVTFRTQVSVHTLATRPRLVVHLSAPKQVLIGDEATMTVQISNPGTGVATGIVLSEHVPHGLRHKAGSDLEFDVGTLRPGQSRQIELSMSAVEAGHVINALQARGDAKLHALARVEFDVVAPALSVAMTGPTRRYLERQATYTVAVSNPGTAPRDVELVTELPKGMKFVKANNAGHYDPQTHTVTWNLEELPPAETGSVTLVAVPIEAGEQRMKIEGKARQGLSDAKEKTVIVEGLAAVTFDVRGADEAIEVGGETTYQIHVVNEGSMAATNLQVTALFPAEMKPLKADGPARNTIDRHRVQFEPIARLEPKGEASFSVRAEAIQPGDLRVKVQVQTDDMRQPVLKEENTRVYVDH